MTIRRLGTDLSLKIAAGEVIERPASVAKELVENSIDAGARNITLELEQGGKTCFTIEDDGCGIEFAELPLALERYATSKISSIDDLENIHTLGYRGEALASVASVSRMEIRSRTENSDTGGVVACEGNHITIHTEISCAIGTRIQIEDLFYNIPARRKFLKTASAELRRIVQVVNDYALIHPEINFTIYSDGKKLLERDAVANIEEALRLRWGKDTRILSSESEKDGILCRVWWNPMEASRRTTVSAFVNERRIQDTTIKAAITSADAAAYGEWLVLIDMPPNLVDVNIHPAKQEVRFRHSQDIFRAVYSNAQNILRDKNLSGKPFALDGAQPSDSFFVEMPSQNLFALKRNNTISTHVVHNSPNIFSQSKIPCVNAQMPVYRTAQTERTEISQYRFMPAERSSESFESVYIGQTGKGFLIFEFAQGIAVVDPHAAHERILYEKIKASFKNEIAVQMLTVPEEIPQALAADIAGNENELKRLGFVCEDAKLIGVPILRGHGKLSALELLRSTLIGLKSEANPDKRDTEVWWRIARLACKSAVKLGQRMERQEAEALMEQLKNCDMPFVCPHGRPTLYIIENTKLEKMFER